MAFLAPPTVEASVCWVDPALNSSREAGSSEASYGSAELSSGASPPIEQLFIGDTRYFFRRPLQGAWYAAGASGWEFSARGIAPAFLGCGQSKEAAYEDWSQQVHTAFQCLSRKRPFEMDANERSQWHGLTSAIDTAKYRRETPIEMRQIGCVDKARPAPSRIAWASGHKEVVSQSQMPGLFAALKPGQWFEAVVRRDPITGRLINVASIQRIEAVAPMSAEEQEAYWQSLPSSKSLPESHLGRRSPE